MVIVELWTFSLHVLELWFGQNNFKYRYLKLRNCYFESACIWFFLFFFWRSALFVNTWFFFQKKKKAVNTWDKRFQFLIEKWIFQKFNRDWQSDQFFNHWKEKCKQFLLTNGNFLNWALAALLEKGTSEYALYLFWVTKCPITRHWQGIIQHWRKI